MELADAHRRITEQANMAEVARLEKEKLSEENKVISCSVTSNKPPRLFVVVCTVVSTRVFYPFARNSRITQKGYR